MGWTRVVLAGLLLTPLLSADAEAGEIGNARRFGLGLVLGAPTGITAKYYFSQPHALDIGVATWGYWDRYTGVYAHASYNWHPSELAVRADYTLNWHVGVGGFASNVPSWWYNDLPYAGGYGGLRLNLGLDLDLEKVPLQFYMELAGNLGVAPGLWFGPTLGIGGRFYF